LATADPDGHCLIEGANNRRARPALALFFSQAVPKRLSVLRKTLTWNGVEHAQPSR
jgi:hypothetical protein